MKEQWSHRDILNLVAADATGGCASYLGRNGATKREPWHVLCSSGLVEYCPRSDVYVITDKGSAMVHEILCVDLPRRVTKDVWVTRDGDEFPAE